MKNILVVDINGTAPTYNYYFVKGLLDEGFNVTVLGKNNKTFTAIHNQKIKYIGIFTGVKLLDYTLNWIKLFSLATRYQVIHIQWLPMLKFTSTELYLLIWLKKINSNIFYTVHNFFPHNSTNKKINNRYMRLYGLVDNLVVHADATTKKIKQYFKEKVTIKIEHGYFYSEFKNRTESKKKYDLIMLGNVLPYKGVEDAIEALAIINDFKIKMLIAGKCSVEYSLKLKQLIHERNLSQQITLNLGFISVENLIDTYLNSALSVMPYKEIEQSGVLYTSLGLNVPIVGYNTGGISETIQNDLNGYLVEKNDIQALADAIKFGLKNRNKWSNFIEKNSLNIWHENAKILKEFYIK